MTDSSAYSVLAMVVALVIALGNRSVWRWDFFGWEHLAVRVKTKWPVDAKKGKSVEIADLLRIARLEEISLFLYRTLWVWKVGQTILVAIFIFHIILLLLVVLLVGSQHGGGTIPFEWYWLVFVSALVSFVLLVFGGRWADGRSKRVVNED